MKISKNNLILLIKEAIDADDEITLDSSMENVLSGFSWALKRIDALDDSTEGKASSISALGDASSVSEIISILGSENLIDED